MKKLYKSFVVLICTFVLLGMAQQSSAQGCSPLLLPLTVNATIGTPDMSCVSATGTQMGRIFRDGVASGCPNKTCPAGTPFNAGATFNFDSYTFTNNNGGTVCYTVNLNTGACGVNVHAVVYMTSYDPTNQCMNYIGDVGSSTSQPFSFEVPAGNDFVIVLENTGSQANCGYGFTLSAPGSAGVGAPGLAVPAGVPTTSEWGLILITLLMLSVGAVVLGKMQPALAGIPASSNSFSQNAVPFSKSIFNKALLITLPVAVLCYVAAIFAHEARVDMIRDIIGITICAPVLAYLIHLFMMFGKKQEA